MVATERIDPARLVAIKGSRMVCDPIIVDERSTSTATNPAAKIRTAIRQERYQHAIETPTYEPIRKAGWGEAALLFSSLSLVEKPPRDVRDMYRWSVRKLCREVLGMDQPELPDVARDVEPPSDRLARRLEDTRKSIKVARDEHYLEHHYDPECSVPKAFWTEWHPGPASREQMDPTDYQPAPVDI